MRIDAVVLDTNVIVSAVLSPAGKPYAALLHSVDVCKVITSEALFGELERSLSKRRIIARNMGVEREIVLGVIPNVATFVDPAPIPATCRDPDDDIVLATAVAGDADCIITSDEDLLVLDPFQGIRILTPAVFLDLISDVGDDAV